MSVSKQVIQQCSPRSRELRMRALVVVDDSFECGQYGSLWIYWHGHTTIAMSLKFSQIPLSDENPSLNDASTLSSHCHTNLLLSLNIFGRVDNGSAKIVVFWRVVAFDSGSASESVKFYRFQFRLRILPRRATPIDSNSGLDSDSAALPVTTGLMSPVIEIYYAVAYHHRQLLPFPTKKREGL